MIRLERKPIPESIKTSGRTRELLGDLKNNTMPNCIYNDIIANGAYDINKYSIEQVEQIIDSSGLTIKSGFLKSYQLDDLRKSLLQDTVYNINKPGYGKTLETIIWLKIRLSHMKYPNILILCPKSVIETWHNQLKRYWPNYLADCNWWITNYEQIYNKENQTIAISTKWDVVILDEM